MCMKGCVGGNIPASRDKKARSASGVEPGVEAGGW